MQWSKLFWNNVSIPTGTAVGFQVSVTANATDPPNFVGPSGSSSWFTTSGASLASFTGRYCQFQVKLTPTATATPTISDVQLSYTQLASQTATLLPSQVRRFTYDPAGNLTEVDTLTDSAGTAPTVATDVRDNAAWTSTDRLNNLNQIKRRDVGGGTYNYSYSLNGNMTQKKKSDGTDQWDYTWNQENRLTQAKHTVSGSVVKTITYAYDLTGRMLSRSDGTTTTKMVWDGWDLVQETDGTNTTTWMIPEGQLLSFIRNGTTYQIHQDALGSVRLVTDSTGAVKARFDYGSWGELLSSSFDNVPNGGMPYRFVGSLGVRYDPDTSLLYMRHRWYDSTLDRFISQDPLGIAGGQNKYVYANNSPFVYEDITGLECCKRKCWITTVYRRTRLATSASCVDVPPGQKPYIGAYHTDIYLKCQLEDCSIVLYRYAFGPKGVTCYVGFPVTTLGRIPSSQPEAFHDLAVARTNIDNEFYTFNTIPNASLNMTATATAINQAKLPYLGVELNCNWAAEQVLNSVGATLPPTQKYLPPYFP